LPCWEPPCLPTGQACRTAIAVGDHGQPTTPPVCPRWTFAVLPAAITTVRRPGGGWSRRWWRATPPRRRKDPVIAERAAEQAGRHDGHALGVQAAAMDAGAVMQARGGVGVQQVADRLGFPADRRQGRLRGEWLCHASPSARWWTLPLHFGAAPPGAGLVGGPKSQPPAQQRSGHQADQPACGRPAWVASTWPGGYQATGSRATGRCRRSSLPSSRRAVTPACDAAPVA